MDLLQVFPNSGHHYQFIPLRPRDAADASVLSRFPELPKDVDKEEWFKNTIRACATNEWDWAAFDEWPWIRYRWGDHFVQHPTQGRVVLLGLWLSIDSNLGSASRGYVYEAREPKPQDQIEFAKNLGNVSRNFYAAADVTRLKENAVPLAKLMFRRAEMEFLLPHVGEKVFAWQEPGAHPIDVDLIIDFGNTRTVALALENVAAAGGKLSTVCRPIRFMPPGTGYEPSPDSVWDDPSAIVDSWIVLHEPVFGSFGPPKVSASHFETRTEKQKSLFGLKSKEVQVLNRVVSTVPQLFVELSPVLLGPPARKVLSSLNIRRSGKSFLSSPKRYAWDTDSVGEMGNIFWTMALNPWNPAFEDKTRIPKLKGEVLRFLPADGYDWGLDDQPTSWDRHKRPDPAPEQPNYPRSDALTWAALSILETAYRQINSFAWRQDNIPTAPRRLRKVLVTFPSGWTGNEIQAYNAKWQKAINVFTLGHLQANPTRNQDGPGPTLTMDMDEAVGSQLPVIFSAIHHLGDQGDNWLQLFGRGTADTARVRAMAIDIGGGTTDISVVEYRDLIPQGSVDLEGTLLFKDSGTIAGDQLVQSIIETVLLPSIAAGLSSGQRIQYEGLFQSVHSSQMEKEEWSRISRLVFVPIVLRWLKDLILDRKVNPATGKSWTPQEAGVQSEDLDAFNEKCRDVADIILANEPLDPLPSHEGLNDCVRNTFSGLFRSLAKYVTAFDCDLVIVTGKPSEVPAVRKLLEASLPINPSRIVFAKDYPAGDWYPMSRDGRIDDAKTVTAVGAALFQAIRNGRIDGWNISRKTSKHLLSRNYWGAMPSGNDPTRFSALYLNPDEGSPQAKDVKIQVNTFIGRKLLDSASQPEQVYQLRWRNPRWRKGDMGNVKEALRVSLRRVIPTAPELGESLEIVKVDGTFDGKPVNVEDVELKLNTLVNNEFWMDTGRFEVRWPPSLRPSDD